jgi:hypothetical protein
MCEWKKGENKRGVRVEGSVSKNKGEKNKIK